MVYKSLWDLKVVFGIERGLTKPCFKLKNIKTYFIRLERVFFLSYSIIGVGVGYFSEVQITKLSIVLLLTHIKTIFNVDLHKKNLF